MIGKTISHYKILEKLGEGGMGVVYKARDLKLDRFVALKFLPPHAGINREEKRRFVHEAKAASRLDHTNICTLYEVDETEYGQLFIAMAFYEGETLKKKIEKGPLKLEDALDIAIQISRGLDEAHNKNIVHRDVKPANLFITDKGDVKILDFGLAKLAGQTRLTKTGTTLGTVAYMSPEQTKGEKTDQRTDIWSLGVVLYEMITGRLPFRGDYEQAVVYSILNEDPESLTGIRTGVPRELERIVNKAMTKNPEDRYQRVEDLTVDIRRFRKESGAAAEAEPEVKKKRPKGKKRNLPAAIAAGTGLMIILAFVLFKSGIFTNGKTRTAIPIACLPLSNETGDPRYDIFQKSVTDLLIVKLEQSDQFRVTSWERLADLLKQVGRESEEILHLDEDTGFELCRLDGVSAVVVGSFSKIGNTFNLVLRVLDVNSKEILATSSADGKGEDSIPAQINKVSRNISRGIGLSERQMAQLDRPVQEVTSRSMEAYNNFIIGREEFERHNWEVAYEFLKNAVETDSTFAVAHYYLGSSLWQLGESRPANQAFAKAIQYVERASEKEQFYIRFYHSWYQERRVDEAFQMVREMVKRFPREKRALYELGKFYSVEQKNYEEAIRLLKEVLKLDPLWGRAWNRLGYTYAAAGDYVSAIESMEKYASVAPGESDPYDSMGEVYYLKGDLDKAIENYKRTLQIRPNALSVWALSYIYALKKQYPEAIQWIDQNIRNPSSAADKADGLLFKAYYCAFRGQIRDALSFLNEAVEIYPSIHDNNMAAFASVSEKLFLTQDGKGETADSMTAQWKEEYNIKNPSFGLLICTAYANLNQGEIDSARAGLNRAGAIIRKTNPANRRYRQNHYDLLYGTILVHEDSLKKAVRILQHVRSIEMPPPVYFRKRFYFLYNLPPLRDALAIAYLKQGHLRNAITVYEELTQFNPETNDRRLSHPLHLYRLAGVYEKSGRNKDAIDAYQRFLELWRDADEDLAELTDARRRLSSLKGAG
jgi:serine/threonine protein kinase/tetratricopeptide (TPR) repeat protein